MERDVTQIIFIDKEEHTSSTDFAPAKKKNARTIVHCLDYSEYMLECPTVVTKVWSMRSKMFDVLCAWRMEADELSSTLTHLNVAPLTDTTGQKSKAPAVDIGMCLCVIVTS